MALEEFPVEKSLGVLAKKSKIEIEKQSQRCRTKGEISENFRASPFGDLPILLRLLPGGASGLPQSGKKPVYRGLVQKERPSLPPKDSDGGANPYACAGVPGRLCWLHA